MHRTVLATGALTATMWLIVNLGLCLVLAFGVTWAACTIAVEAVSA